MNGAAGEAAAEGVEESTTCFIGQLSWNVDNDWLASEFADCGEVVSARVQMDRNTGKSRGFGFVEFATAEGANAAAKLNGSKEIDGRTVKIDKTQPKAAAASPDKRAKVFGDVQSPPTSTLFVGNISWNTTEDDLWGVFGDYGDVKSVRLPTDRESGKPKGFGYVEFSDVESAKKAMEALKGYDLDGRQLRLDFSTPKDNNGGGGGRGGGGRGGGRGGFGGGRGGRGGGDSGWGGRGVSLCFSMMVCLGSFFVREEEVVAEVLREEVVVLHAGVHGPEAPSNSRGRK